MNDTYGQLVRDRVIVKVAGALRSIMREGDILVRYGGEEFLAVAPAASLQDTRIIGERYRRIVEEMVIRDGDQQLKVTVSVGTAAVPDIEASTEQELIRAADVALYQAKEQGRNRVVVGC